MREEGVEVGCRLESSIDMSSNEDEPEVDVPGLIDFGRVSAAMALHARLIGVRRNLG